MQYENSKWKSLVLFNSNFAVGNLRLPVGKLQLPAPSTSCPRLLFLTHGAAGTHNRQLCRKRLVTNCSYECMLCNCLKNVAARHIASARLLKDSIIAPLVKKSKMRSRCNLFIVSEAPDSITSFTVAINLDIEGNIRE